MGYLVDADFWTIVGLAAAAGAVGGLVWDIGNAVRKSATAPVTGIDNVIELPRFYRSKAGNRAIDLGLFGPILVGAVGGILVVLLVGRTSPDATDTATALVDVSEAANDGTTAQVDAATESAAENLGARIDRDLLVVLGLLGGLGGWGLLSAMTTRATQLLEAAVGAVAGPAAAQAAGEALDQQQEEAGSQPARPLHGSSAPIDKERLVKDAAEIARGAAVAALSDRSAAELGPGSGDSWR